MEDINKRIRAVRLENGLSQKQVADFVVMSQSSYSKIEQGSQKLLADDLVKLSTLYNMTLDELIFGNK